MLLTLEKAGYCYKDEYFIDESEGNTIILLLPSSACYFQSSRKIDRIGRSELFLIFWFQITKQPCR